MTEGKDVTLLGMVGGHSQRRGRLGKSRVDMTRLSWVMAVGVGKRTTTVMMTNQVPQPGGQRCKREGNQSVWVI